MEEKVSEVKAHENISAIIKSDVAGNLEDGPSDLCLLVFLPLYTYLPLKVGHLRDLLLANLI